MGYAVPDVDLKKICKQCGATTCLYRINCRHLTLCYFCAKDMYHTAAHCPHCKSSLKYLILGDNDPMYYHLSEEGVQYSNSPVPPPPVLLLHAFATPSTAIVKRKARANAANNEPQCSSNKRLKFQQKVNPVMSCETLINQGEKVAPIKKGRVKRSIPIPTLKPKRVVKRSVRLDNPKQLDVSKMEATSPKSKGVAKRSVSVPISNLSTCSEEDCDKRWNALLLAIGLTNSPFTKKSVPVPISKVNTCSEEDCEKRWNALFLACELTSSPSP